MRLGLVMLLLLSFQAEAGPKCPVTIKLDLTKTGWTEFDNKTIKRAEYVCATRYAPRSPCLVKFFKKGFQEYAALCGAKR